MYLALKLVLSATIIALVSEVAKMNPRIGGLIASLPLVSILAMTWLYFDTRDAQAVALLSREIFWLVLPSLLLFLALPVLLRTGLHFAWALSGAVAIMLAAYAGMLLLARIGSGSP